MTAVRRVLVAVPAYNEQATIARVVGDIRAAVPEFDLLIVDDASNDGTSSIVAGLDAAVATHLANLGYGRALQTAIKYAQRRADIADDARDRGVFVVGGDRDEHAPHGRHYDL